jgi:hypothetical protein
MELLMTQIKDWMRMNWLQMNDTKTEVILIGNRRQLNKTETRSLRIGDTEVLAKPSIKYLGVDIDDTLSFVTHIKSKCRKAMFNTLLLGRLVNHLSTEAAKAIASALVLSHLDYANSVFACYPATLIKRMQRVQNFAAKTILKYKRRDSATDALRRLHWLPVQSRCNYKVLVLVFKCLNVATTPSYLKDLLSYKTQQRQTRKTNQQQLGKILEVPYTKRMTFADRSFSVYGPKLWNNLPIVLRAETNLDHFKKSLKTYLFNKYFNKI